MLLVSGGLFAQPIFIDQFDDGVPGTDGGPHFDVTEMDGEMLVSGLGTNGAWDGVWYQLPQDLDLSADGAAKLYVRAKSTNLGTALRMDLADRNGGFTNVSPITRTLVNDYVEFEFDFTSVDIGNFDLTQVQAIFFFIDGGVGNFNGTLAFDYFAIGEAPAPVIMSDIYQDHMDSDSSLANFANIADVVGMTAERTVDGNGDSTVISLIGDGSTLMWQPVAYLFRSAPDYIPTDVDISENTKIFVKARTNVVGTSLRLDVQDVDNLSSTGNAITRVLTTEYEVYEYDLVDARQTFANDACPTADTDPCFLNLEAIKEFLLYINPGSTNFAGSVDIDWISIGTNLDGEGPEAVLTYFDQFENDRVNFAGGVAGFELDEADGIFSITGDGTSAQWGSVSYDFQEPTDDQDTADVQQVIDMTDAQGKLFIRARTIGDPQTLRIDLRDTSGLNTDLAGITQRITNEWKVYTYDFLGNYNHAFGGNPDCTPASPCPVDDTNIAGVFFFPRPGEENFSGTIEIDWLSIGQPLEEDMPTEPGILNYGDELDNAGDFFSGNPGGVTYNVTDDGYFQMTGDGTSPTYQQVRYALRNDAGGSEKADVVGSGNIIYVRARILDNDAGADMRIDLVDEGGFESTNAGSQNTISGEEFVTYEYRYSNYEDGGYGGTACASGPCPVDGERITGLVFYPSPDAGAFTGTIDVNWIGIGVELMPTNVDDFAELDALKVYPNPASDEIAIEYDLPAASQVMVSLFDAMGRRVLVQDLGQRGAGNNFTPVNISELAAGTYHLQVTVNGAPARATTILKR